MMGRRNEKRKAVASFVLGIVGMVAWLFPLLGFPISLTGLFIGWSVKETSTKTATTGVVLSTIALCLSSINGYLARYLIINGLIEWPL